MCGVTFVGFMNRFFERVNLGTKFLNRLFLKYLHSVSSSLVEESESVFLPDDSTERSEVRVTVDWIWC